MTTLEQMKPSARIDRPKILSGEEVADYVEQGFCVVEDLVSPSEVDQIKRDAADLARGKYPCQSLKPLPPETTDDQAMRNILCIHQPHFVSPVIESFTKHEKICGVLSQIVGAHLPHWDGSVKCMQSMLFIKPPTFPGQSWHQDEIFIPTRDRSLTGAWIALEDATVDNGCLWILPGSHQSGYLYPQRAHDNPDFDAAAESYGFDDSSEVPVEVKAGSVVFFNGYLLHRSRKNVSDRYRRVLVSHYMNAWSLLPWGLREGESPSICDRRGIIPVAGIDPYAWKGYEQSEHEVYLRGVGDHQQK